MAIQIKSEVELKKIERNIIDQFRDVEMATERYRKIGLEHYKNYNSKIGKRFYNGRSDIFVPMSFQVVETLLTRITTAIWSEPVPIFLQGIGAVDHVREEKTRALLHMQQKKFVRLKKKIQDYWRAKLIYGRGFAKMCWRTEYRKRTIPEFITDTPDIPEGGIGRPEVLIEKQNQVVFPIYDCWDFIPLDFFDMFVDPVAPDGDIERASFVAERRLITYNDLLMLGTQKDENGKPIYDNFKDLKGKGEGSLSEELIERKRMLGVDTTSTELNQDGKTHELLEVWMDVDVDGDGVPEKNCLVTLLDRDRIIRCQENPFWHGMKPYISSGVFRRPNEFYSQGPLDPIRRLQYEINDKRNQSLDYATMSLNAVWLVGDGAGIEEDQLRVGQNSVIHARDINQMRQVIFPDLTGVGIQAESILENNIRETTGATRSVQGLSEGGRRTASEYSTSLSYAGERIRSILESYGEEAWVPMWEMAHNLNLQFLRKETAVRLTATEASSFLKFGSQGSVHPADIAMGIDFIVPSFADVEQMNLRNQNLLTFLQLIQTLPPSPDNFKMYNILIKKIWTELFKFKTEDLFSEGQPLNLTQPGATDAINEMMGIGTRGGGGLTPPQTGTENIPNELENFAKSLEQSQQQVPTGGI